MFKKRQVSTLCLASGSLGPSLSEGLLCCLLLQLALVEQAARLNILRHKHIHGDIALQEALIHLHQPMQATYFPSWQKSHDPLSFFSCTILARHNAQLVKLAWVIQLVHNWHLGIVMHTQNQVFKRETQRAVVHTQNHVSMYSRSSWHLRSSGDLNCTCVRPEGDARAPPGRCPCRPGWRLDQE